MTTTMTLPLTKSEAVAVALEAAPDVPTVFTTGYIARIGAAADRRNHFYMTGSMGLALSLGTGIALRSRRTTLVVDGDGSLLMNPVGLVAAAEDPDLPLIQLVLDDGVYASTGGQRAPGSLVDLPGWARACGFARIHAVDSAQALAEALRGELLNPPAPVFIHCTVTADTTPPPPRVTDHLEGITARFSDFLQPQG
ncbi:thiamine pyrophosphate-dependent enzyme [Streptomyces sp. NBC_00239]|uniref:thiamine pyrophosphate-dependent enzyme n=1 Tax=Streptomyces sp. NBC_00239 TaxID=2903640 RepID=UPI002E2AEC4F|nr:thiamine pyrophosphate-dependent enzyme [Streptomyces sp. NBC_00239]